MPLAVSDNLVDDAFADIPDAWDVVVVPETWRPQRSPMCREERSCNWNACEHCRERQGLNRRDSLAPRLTGRRLQFVTLTTLPDPQGPRAVRNLLKSFAKLTRRAVWKHVLGGVRNVHPGYHADGWTFHVHAVVEVSRLIDEEKLSAVWHSLTGASDVDVRAVNASWEDHFNVVGYTLRPSLGKVPAGRLSDYSAAIKSFHLYRRFGSWRRFTGMSKPRKTQPPPTPSTSLGYGSAPLHVSPLRQAPQPERNAAHDANWTQLRFLSSQQVTTICLADVQPTTSGRTEASSASTCAQPESQEISGVPVERTEPSWGRRPP